MKKEVTPIRALVIDPNAEMRQHLAGLLEDYPGVEVVSTLPGSVGAINEIRSCSPEVVFIRVNLPESNGFDLIQSLPPGVQPHYVIVSENPEDAAKAFDYMACDFLQVPFTKDRLQLTMMKLREQIMNKGTSQLHEKLNALFRYINPAKYDQKGQNGHSATKLLPVKMSGRIYFIQPSEIEFVEAAGYYIEVYARGKKHLIRQSLTQLDSILDSRHFIRIHRSVIINLEYLKEIVRDGANDFSVRMTNDTLFKISRSYKPEVFERIGM